MKRWFIVGVASIALMGCEVMDDMAWSDSTHLRGSKSEDGMYIETYQTDTYGNFTGDHVGIRYDYYVTNRRSDTLCYRLNFDSVSADNYHHREIYRIEPGQKSWVGYASIFSTTGGKSLRVEAAQEWGWIDYWENCQTDIIWQ